MADSSTAVVFYQQPLGSPMGLVQPSEGGRERQVESEESESLVFSCTTGEYCRSQSDETERLTAALCSLYSTSYAVVSPSGCCAVSTALRGVLNSLIRCGGSGSAPRANVPPPAKCDRSNQTQNENPTALAPPAPLQTINNGNTGGTVAVSIKVGGNCDEGERKKRIMVVCDLELFGATRPLLDSIAEETNVGPIMAVDCSDSAALMSACEPHTDQGGICVVFAESCSNPSGRVFAFEAVPILRQKATAAGGQVVVIIDDTWTTVASCNVLDLGADISISSLTKYYSDNSAIAGMVTSRNQEFLSSIRRWHSRNGMHVSPHDAHLISAALPLFSERLREASQLAIQILSTLRENGVEVMHPMTEDHPTHERALGVLKIWPPVFCVKRRHMIKKVFLAAVQERTHLALRTSYGGKHTRVDNHPHVSSNSLTFRVAVGYQDREFIDRIVQEILVLTTLH
ncbi:Cys/Met metabolism, pyridoxal phosphate-dependent enzyme [Pelomyxa schiedti]|nr:Cys/Met metabolism, pyridoxal phosphate-dependent enzyme [Pelomyxa schiedti]